MPFLIPAITAACCDCFILYLSQYSVIPEAVESTTEGLSTTCGLIYHTSYILPAAGLRLFLLLVPLPYYSYHGTALKFPEIYKLFYGCLFLVLLCHIFAFSLCDPSSLSALLPTKSHLNPLDDIAADRARLAEASKVNIADDQTLESEFLLQLAQVQIQHLRDQVRHSEQKIS